jgi:hypothetical protein
MFFLYGASWTGLLLFENQIETLTPFLSYTLLFHIFNARCFLGFRDRRVGRGLNGAD